MKTRILAGCISLAGLFAVACGSSSTKGCPNCAKFVACCDAEADAGAPSGGRCVGNPGEVTTIHGQSSSCNSDPGIAQGDADGTCASDVTTEGALPNAPAACH